MARTAPAPSASLSRRDAEERHNRVLLHALQTAHPVIYQGMKRFIHSLFYGPGPGGIETIVYLAGSAESIPPADITLAPPVE